MQDHALRHERPAARMAGVRAAVASLAALALTIALAGCKAPPPPTHYYICLDLSASITQAQRDQWIDAVSGKTLRVVRPGDRVTIFGMHGRTAYAAPLYDATLPPAAESATVAGMDALKRAMKALRRDASRKISESLTSGAGAPESDILSIFNRIRTDAAPARTEILIVSDMLNSTRELNLEKQPIDRARIQVLIPQLFASHQWNVQTLQGARVHCLLNSITDGDRVAVNDRIIIREFWRSLIQSLGGEVASFDSYLDSQSMPGGQS